MRKNFGKQTWVYPMPVFMIGTYDENGVPDVMNAAWGGVYDGGQIMLCLTHSHKTVKNIKLKEAFTVSFATAKTVVECDYLGIVSANDTPDKLERAGFHTVKSEFVDAPVISELPMTLECKLLKFNEDGNVIGEIVNVCADESILDEGGKIDHSKLEAITYDGVHSTYICLGDVVGQAFVDGKKIK